MLKLVDAKVKRRQANEGLIKKDLMYHFYVMEDKLKQFITRSPTDELGVFALRWEEMEEEQQAAAEVRRPAFSAFFSAPLRLTQPNRGTGIGVLERP